MKAHLVGRPDHGKHMIQLSCHGHAVDSWRLRLPVVQAQSPIVRKLESQEIFSD